LAGKRQAGSPKTADRLRPGAAGTGKYRRDEADDFFGAVVFYNYAAPPALK
jgi:hypothetical protein